jgi:predicted ATPase
MYLRTLGDLRLEGSSYNQRKPLLLLAYLAVEGSTDRSDLAALFFPGRKDSRDNLSTTLYKLRREGDSLYQEHQEQLATPLQCDTTELLNLLNEQKYQEAIGFYKGAFLKGFDAKLDAGLTEWIFNTREVVAGRVRHAYLSIAENMAAQGELVKAARYAESAYFLPGAPEPEIDMIERIYPLLVAGNSSRCDEVRKDAASFGVGLLSQRNVTSRAKAAPNVAVGPAPHNLPEAQLFVGRTQEILEVRQLLSSQETRLVTLLGGGGIGKSRLAVEVARDLLGSNPFKDGIYLTQLEAVGTPDLVMSSVAATLPMRLQNTDTVFEQVSHFLCDKHILLVLDNYEHLIEAAVVASQLLRACPNLKMLVTSREKLSVKEEWLVPLEGLSYPSHETPAEDASAYEAVSLFVRLAKRQQRDFQLTQASLPAVLAICQWLEGLPLGLELAATWLRFMALEDIAQSVEHSYDLLTSDLKDVPSRHRSLKATFEHSWQLLSEKERQVLEQVSVFKGGFTREAAGEIAGTTLPLLASLVNKSLLRVSQRGRYDCHPLLLQFFQQKLLERGALADEVRRRHAQYYLAYLGDKDDPLMGGRYLKSAAISLVEELANLRVAWNEGLRRGMTEHLVLGIEVMAPFAEITGKYFDMEIFMDDAINTLDPTRSENGAVIGGSLAARSFANYRSGDYDGVTRDSLAAIAALTIHQTQRQTALWLAHLTLGIRHWIFGDAANARAAHQAGLEVAQIDYERAGSNGSDKKNATIRMGISYHNLGMVEIYFGEQDANLAEQYLLKSKQMQLETGSPYLCFTRVYLGEYYLLRNRLAEAKRELQLGLTFASELGYLPITSYLYATLARVCFHEGDVDAALRVCAEADVIIKQCRDVWSDSIIKSLWGRIALSRGEFQKANHWLSASITAALSIKAYLFAIEPILGYATLQYQQQNFTGAARLCGFLLQQQELSKVVRKEIESLSSALESRLTQNMLDECLRAGKRTTFEQLKFITQFVDVGV